MLDYEVVKTVSEMVMKVDQLLKSAYQHAAAELGKIAEAAALGIHVYGVKLKDGKHAIPIIDYLWLRSDNQFAEFDPTVTISYEEVVAKYHVNIVKTRIKESASKYADFQKNFMEKLKKEPNTIKEIKNKRTPKPKKPSHLHSV